MSWINNNSNDIKVGDKVILTKRIGLDLGYFEKGSIVTVNSLYVKN